MYMYLPCMFIYVVCVWGGICVGACWCMCMRGWVCMWVGGYVPLCRYMEVGWYAHACLCVLGGHIHDIVQCMYVFRCMNATHSDVTDTSPVSLHPLCVASKGTRAASRRDTSTTSLSQLHTALKERTCSTLSKRPKMPRSCVCVCVCVNGLLCFLDVTVRYTVRVSSQKCMYSMYH